MLLWFIAGIVVGWVVEFIIDWRFWRRAVFSSEPVDVAVLNEVATLRRKLKECEVRIQEFEQQREATQSRPSEAVISSESAPPEPTIPGNSSPVIGDVE